MEIKQLKLSQKQAKEIGWNQIYFLEFDEPIILSNTYDKSLKILRDIFEPDYSEEKQKEFKEFWDIIHNHQLKIQDRIIRSEETKQKHYNIIRIKSKERTIENLKEKLKQHQEELKKLKSSERGNK